MTTETIKHHCKDVFRLPVIVMLFLAYIAGNMYATILNSSYASEMSHPLAVNEVPFIYFSMIANSIDSEMAYLLPPETATGAGETEKTAFIPVPREKPLITLSSL